MNPIQPVGSGAAGAQQVRPAQTEPVATAGTSATSVTAASSSTSVTMVNTQVDAMLENIGGGLQDNQLLKMVIGLLILQALLAKDGGGQQAAIESLMDLLGTGGGQRTQSLSMHSATNVVQIQQQSSVVMTGQAALAPTSSQGDPGGSGEQIDVSA